MDLATSIYVHLGALFDQCWRRVAGDLFTPSSQISIYSLLTALALAIVWIRVSHGRARPRVLLRALFPRRWRVGPSARSDWGFAALNIFITGTLIGWAVVSSDLIGDAVRAALADAFGAPQSVVLPHWAAITIMTAAVYLAYELAYFTDHYLSHHIPLLWHFHRTHHTAETLSPVTNFRVHPIDSLVFYNFIGLFTGLSAGITGYWLPGTAQFTLGGGNALLIAGLYLLTHLHHSHIWLPFTGPVGRVVMSPAHHQVHHSENPDHFNRNFGNTLALFDWVAGTLHVPSRKPARLTFGSGPYAVDPHGISGGLVQPFVDAAQGLAVSWRAGRDQPMAGHHGDAGNVSLAAKMVGAPPVPRG